MPVYIAVGEMDMVTPKKYNAELYADGIPGAKLKVLPGEIGHIIHPMADEELAQKI